MITELTIKRSEWATPDKTDEPRLYVASGLKCCLGFAALACGKNEAEILGKGMPRHLMYGSEIKQFLLPSGRNTDLSEAAQVINDNPKISNKERERQLTELFAANGIALNFVD